MALGFSQAYNLDSKTKVWMKDEHSRDAEEYSEAYLIDGTSSIDRISEYSQRSSINSV